MNKIFLIILISLSMFGCRPAIRIKFKRYKNDDKLYCFDCHKEDAAKYDQKNLILE